MIAQDFLDFHYAGLLLTGRNSKGEYQWNGTDTQWNQVSYFRRVRELIASL